MLIAGHVIRRQIGPLFAGDATNLAPPTSAGEDVMGAMLEVHRENGMEVRSHSGVTTQVFSREGSTYVGSRS